MENEKFTPGEWRAVINEPLEDDHICDVYDSNNNCICECFSCGYWGDKKGISEAQKEANMHLIAAAPSMYEFIRWIASVEGQCAILMKDPEIVRKAQQIIKKARGEENPAATR